MMNRHHYAPLATAAVLLLAGAWRIASDGGEGWPLLILGSTSFGGWLVMHGHDRHDREEH